MMPVSIEADQFARRVGVATHGTNNRPIWLDITRLLERACIGTLTGIDRVELAYAETLLATVPDRTSFVTLGRCTGVFKPLPTPVARTFLTQLRHAWRSGHPAQCRPTALRLLAAAAIARHARADTPPTYLLVSHRHLHRPNHLRNALNHAGAAFIPLIHDLIPLEFPEYARPREAARHRARLATVAALADGVIANSAATADALAPWLSATLPIHIAPLGLAKPDPIAPVPASPGTGRPEQAYFICVGTIEPRKNHLLLLHLWRRLIAEHGQGVPHLLIVGKRGWENENILDLLDRCSALRSHVRELGTIPDTSLAELLAGARALLMPSFAEGFGLPVAEALAAGTPVLCSNLPALREAGGNVPEYLDPLDTPSWQQAILDYARPDSPRRQNQMNRLPGWTPTSWQHHVATVLEFTDHLPQRQPVRSTTPARQYLQARRSTQAALVLPT
jgi:glycosyltransferase involved in cell wall biosynthesis